jgi:hypothetical protein
MFRSKNVEDEGRAELVIRIGGQDGKAYRRFKDSIIHD